MGDARIDFLFRKESDIWSDNHSIGIRWSLLRFYRTPCTHLLVNRTKPIYLSASRQTPCIKACRPRNSLDSHLFPPFPMILRQTGRRRSGWGDCGRSLAFDRVSMSFDWANKSSSITITTAVLLQRWQVPMSLPTMNTIHPLHLIEIRKVRHTWTHLRKHSFGKFSRICERKPRRTMDDFMIL